MEIYEHVLAFLRMVLGPGGYWRGMGIRNGVDRRSGRILDTVARDLVLLFLIVIVGGRGDSSAMWKPTGRESFFFWTQLL